jgi:hypothetical protein
MTAPPIIPAATYGTCQYCARLRPMQADGLVALHYLRYGTSQPRRRRRCPGSRLAPRGIRS